MRPLITSNDYFDGLNHYFSSIVYTDSIPLKQSGLNTEKYSLYNDYGNEPDSSFLQAIKLEVTKRLGYFMGESSDKVTFFIQYNPLCEGLVITDIDITTYRSTTNSNHFFHRVLFSVFNTTRYNTISLKADLYQDSTPIMNDWNKVIGQIQNSENVSNSNSSTLVYVSVLQLLNNKNCVLGQEDTCEYKGYNLSGSFSQILNKNLLKPVNESTWLQPNAFPNNSYTNKGYYDEAGNIVIMDNGPSNIDELIKRFKK
jgi:hypothetical protein